ncbi:MAG: hypothetical protein ACXVEF_07520 [Polyangiales bacterium]
MKPAHMWSIAAASAALVLAAPAEAQRGGRGGGHANVNRANVNHANVNRANTNIHNTNVNANRNVNVNQNVNVNREVDVHGGYGYHYDSWGHPIATAAAVTATAMVVGTMVASLPTSGCSGVSVGGVAYQHCGSTYYQPVYQGTSVQYVVVEAPK